jgi:hypothetical protein
VESQNRGHQGQSDQNQGGHGNRRRRRRSQGGAHRPSSSHDHQTSQNAGSSQQGVFNPRQDNTQAQRSEGGHQPRQGGPRNYRSGGRHGGENRQRSHQSGSRTRSRSGRVLTINQVLVKYDNLLEQHLITRRKYYEYFNRVDDRQLNKLEKNFFDSIEHLRRFEANLEPWQKEALERRKTERYKLDLTYSSNRGWDPVEETKVEITSEEIEDPHFTDNQKEAFEEYRTDTEESSGSYEDYLRYKGLE